MKKNLTLITGIAILVAIFIAGACSTEGSDDDIRDSNNVTIYLKKVVEIEGKMHLEMYNSYDPGKKVVVDSLLTIVKPGMIVFWEPERESGIKKIGRIGSSIGIGNIFKKDASKVFLSKKFRLRVPGDASGEEKYDIIFEDEEGEPGNIDPHLIIPVETPE